MAIRKSSRDRRSFAEEPLDYVTKLMSSYQKLEEEMIKQEE
jgi:hypothetical protein